jgi:hypothetical protein
VLGGLGWLLIGTLAYGVVFAFKKSSI